MKTAIIGGSGFAGGGLIRLLLHHPKIELEHVTSNRFAGNFVYYIHPNLRGHTNIKFTPYDQKTVINSCDEVFMATPHATSYRMVPQLLVY